VKGRAFTLVTGLGALAALAVMLAFVVANAGDGDDGPATLPGLRPESLTVSLHDEQLPTVPVDQIPARLDRISQSGVTIARVDVWWIDVAPSKPADPGNPSDPAYRWERLDATIDGLATRRVAPLVTLSRTPGWANGNQGPEWAPNPDDYSAFVRALVSRYRGSGHGTVTLLEPWNEPNNPLSLMPQWDGSDANAKVASAGLYADLVARARREVDAVAPEVAIIGMSAADIPVSTPPTGGVGVVEFLQALAPQALDVDAVSQHLRPTAAPNAPADAIPSFATLPRLLIEIDRVAPDAPLLVTEVGYATPPGVLSEADQSTYVTQTLERLAANPRVRLVVWSTLQDTSERLDGLLRADGSEKAAWTTFVAGPKALPSAVAP
jgi:hypothetical protein